MPVTITRFRQDLFRLADEALTGKSVEFLYKGVVFQVLPARISTGNKLDALIATPTLAHGEPRQELQTEMESAWLKDWSQIR